MIFLQCLFISIRINLELIQFWVKLEHNVNWGLGFQPFGQYVSLESIFLSGCISGVNILIHMNLKPYFCTYIKEESACLALGASHTHSRSETIKESVPFGCINGMNIQISNVQGQLTQGAQVRTNRAHQQQVTSVNTKHFYTGLNIFYFCMQCSKHGVTMYLGCGKVMYRVLLHVT